MTSARGRMLLLKFAKAGEILGLEAIISGKPYEVAAEIVERSRIAFISQDDFLRFLRRHREACLRAARLVSEGCRDAYDRLRCIGLSHTVAGRLARFLLERSTEGEETSQGIRVESRLGQEEVAQIIGSSRETVNRLLGRFTIQEFVQVQVHILWVRNPRALAGLIDA
jgi:CRP/FNR family transcriptional regulator, cyclic AMP receptor protein